MQAPTVICFDPASVLLYKRIFKRISSHAKGNTASFNFLRFVLSLKTVSRKRYVSTLLTGNGSIVM